MPAESTDTEPSEVPSLIQPLVGDALLNLFARDPYDMTPEDIAAIVAHCRRARAAGQFREVAHKAIAAGKPPPKARKSAVKPIDATSGPTEAAPKTRKPREPRKRDS